MATMEGFQVREYQNSLPETVMSPQIIPPSMMVKSYIIIPLRLIVIPIKMFGKNFRIMSSTEQVFLVTSFLNKLATTNSVAIVIAATIMLAEGGAVFVALFGQEIEFTNKMYKGIINPNQCKSFGVQCVDDPTDPTRKLVFYAKNVFLPRHMQGTNCLEDFFCPSGDELQQIPWVFMSDEAIWYPYNITYPTILDMSQTIYQEADPFVSRSTQTLYI